MRLAIDGDDLRRRRAVRPGRSAARSTPPWAPRSTARPRTARRSCGSRCRLSSRRTSTAAVRRWVRPPRQGCGGFVCNYSDEGPHRVARAASNPPLNAPLKFDPPQWPRWTCPPPSAPTATTSRPTCPAARSCSPPAAAASPRARSPRSTSAGCTDDTDANVDANRERLAAAAGHPRERFVYGRQVHGASVRRATEPPGPERPAAEEDGQATALDDVAALVFTADCLPVMLVADGGRRGAARRLARAGRRDRRRGRRRAARARRDRADHRRARPGARAAAATRSARRSTRTSRATTRASASATSTSRRSHARSSSAPGSRQVHDVGAVHDVRRRRALLLPPPRQGRHRAPGGGRMAGLITGLEPEAVRAATERVREEIAAAAQKAGRDPPTSSCSPRSSTSRSRSSACSPRPGLTLVGENRAQELEAKATAHPRAALALHRPAPEPQGQADPAVRRADPLGRVGLRAAPARAPRHARDARSSSRSTSPGRRARPASPRTSSAPSSSALRCGSSGLMTMPPFSRGSGGQPAPFRGPARARRGPRTDPALDGHVAGFRGRRRGGCDHRACRHPPVWGMMQGNRA